MTTFAPLPSEFEELLGSEPTPSPAQPSRLGPLEKPFAMVRSIPNGATYAGTALIIIGFALLAVAWGKIAGIASVALQLPYIASAGFTGLGLVVCGVAVINSASRARDGEARRTQLRELTMALTALEKMMGEHE